MDSQQATTNVTKTTELTDLEDRSRFLKSLGFARDRMVQGNAAVQTGNSAVVDNDADDDDGMVLSSNFDDDEELESSASAVLMDSARSLSEPFGLGEIDLGGDVQDKEVLEIETRFAEESSFDLAGIDDATWEAVNYRLQPEPSNWREAEAVLEADLKKKTIPTAFSEPVNNSVSETPTSATPPPLPEDDDIEEILIESRLDPEIEKAAEPPSDDDEPPRDESLTVNCPSCERGLTLQPEHLGIPGCCVWCETPIIAATSGVDHTVGVFELAVEKPEEEDILVTPPQPKADPGIVGHSKLADLPTQKTSAPQAEAPAPEPAEVEDPEVTLPPTDEISKEATEAKPPVTRSQEPEPEVEVKTELPPKAEAKEKVKEEESSDEVETVEAIPEPKNNFPWNAPTSPKKNASASKLVPPPIEVESELLLDEITDPEPEEPVNIAPAKEATPLVEVTSQPKEEEGPRESKKAPLPPIDSPLPELDTAALSSWKEPAASPFDPPVEKKEEPKQESPPTDPVQAASAFGSPAVPDQKESADTTPAPTKAVSPFDPIPNTTGAQASNVVQEEAEPASFSAASPFGSTAETNADAKPEAAIPDSTNAQAPNATPEGSEPASFSAASPFGTPDENGAKAEAATPESTDANAPNATPEESKPTSFSAVSPFGTPDKGTAKADAAIPDSGETQIPNPAQEESKPTSFSAASPFGSPTEDATKTEATESQAPDPAPEESKPASFAAASPFGPPKEVAQAPEAAVSDPLPDAAPALDSAPPENESASSNPLPWDLPNDVVPDSDSLNVEPESTDKDDPMGPPSDLPENEGSLPPKDGPSAATVSTKIEKSVRRKKSRSSKGSRTAITIALLGLISGAGIASFFLPVGGYIENAKASWTEWFESKIGVENSWDQEALPAPTDEPVAIPAPSLPESATPSESTPTPETSPPVSTTSEDEPDPFESNKAPGS